MAPCLAFALALAATSPGFIPDFIDVDRGDANGDHAVDIADGMFIQSYLFLGGNQPPCLEAADVNDDGAVDLSDAVYLYAYIFQGGPRPPAPFPNCGYIPAQGNLPCEEPSCP